MSAKKILLTMVFSILCLSLHAQSVHCDIEQFKNADFNEDSVATFNNSFVNNNALPNIKYSHYPIEIRVYAFGNNSQHVKVRTIQFDGYRLYINQHEIILSNTKIGANSQEIFNKGRTSGSKQSSRKEVEMNCTFLEELIKDDLFIMLSSKQTEVIRNPNVNVMDSGGSYKFEIKVFNKFRNFEYYSDINYTDTTIGRSEKVHKIYNYMIKL